MSYRLNAPCFTVWKRRGYLLSMPMPDFESEVFGVDAWAPGCKDFHLHLIVHRGKVEVVQLMRAPVKPKRKWQEVQELRDYKEWEKLPAAWFPGKVLQLLKEFASERAQQDEQRGTARAGQ